MRIICANTLLVAGWLLLAFIIVVGTARVSREELAVLRVWDIVLGSVFLLAYVVRRAGSSAIAKNRWLMRLRAVLMCAMIGGALMLWQEYAYQAYQPSRELRAFNQVARVLVALDGYRDDHGPYPTTEEGLAVLLATAERRSGPYLDADALIDPWGNPLNYKNADNVIAVWSLGPDGESGTDDDIALPKAVEAKPGERASPPRE
jgi:general secretion pathway protein G